MSSPPTVAVLREGTEGLPMSEYAREVRERLPEYSIGYAPTPRAERSALRTATVATGVTVDPEHLEAAPNLELFQCVFAGVDHLPLDALAEAGVTVSSASGIHAPGIAEQVLAQMLTFARELHRARSRQEAHAWEHFQPGEFMDSTVTIVGMGSIGSAVAKRLAGFDVETLAVRSSEASHPLADEVFGYDRLHEALSRTDYLVLAAPLTGTTRGLIGSAEFATLPPSAVLVNVARGGLVDTDALVSALQKNAIRGAALDVTEPEPLPGDHPLWDLDSCLLTPHVGGHTPHHWPRMAEILERNVRALLEENGDLENHVEL